MTMKYAFPEARIFEDTDAETRINVGSAADRLRLTGMIIKLFELWELSPSDQASLLGLSPNSRTSLNNYKTGRAFANSPDLLERAGHLLSIHKSLRILYPHDRALAYSWVRCPNRAFGALSPLEVMLSYRFAGLLKVKGYLAFARSR